MSVRKKRSLVPSAKKPLYDQLTQKLVASATVAGYQEALDGLKSLSKQVTELQSWIAWWDARRSTLFTAFIGTPASGSNQAEIGNNMWQQRKRNLNLVDAAYDDMATSIKA